MGPPIEHGGMEALEPVEIPLFVASMGPPIEHGGMLGLTIQDTRDDFMLQWGRRLNTAECCGFRQRTLFRNRRLQWGPPLEHGGMTV